MNVHCNFVRIKKRFQSINIVDDVSDVILLFLIEEAVTEVCIPLPLFAMCIPTSLLMGFFCTLLISSPEKGPRELYPSILTLSLNVYTLMSWNIVPFRLSCGMFENNTYTNLLVQHLGCGATMSWLSSMVRLGDAKLCIKVSSNVGLSMTCWKNF